MRVGEQPGDQEDREGRPFVGPAGRILDDALQELKLERRSIYVTNAVKHFKHEQRGKRRIYKHPNRSELEQCRWWLDRELVLINPKLVIALGAVAAGALMGRTLSLHHKILNIFAFCTHRRLRGRTLNTHNHAPRCRCWP
jgi:uracil-DNA glycosylase family protein